MVAVLVIDSANEGAFVRHHDVREIAAATDGDGYDATAQVHALYDRLAALAVPSIAVVAGACMGAWLELALACTLRYAAQDAGPFGFPEVTLRIIPGGGGTQRAPRAIGGDGALELMLTGRLFDAREAHRLGLFQALSDDVAAHAGRVAKRIASPPAAAVAAIRKLVALDAKGPIEEGRAAEQTEFAALLQQPPTRERIAALAEAGFPVVR
jgi:enoyl-CoA hydratase/carnithine racemase